MSDNAEQRDFWTDQVGDKWVAHQVAMDALLQPVLDGVLQRADLRAGDYVIDIGCGTGSSCLQAAHAVGPGGTVLGADISPTLLRLARSRTAETPNITLVEADAARHPFDPRSADHLISRFGVMFFANPVAAFAHMAKGVKPGGKVSFACWGQIPNNPYFTEPAAAARAVLGPVPKPDPDAPGPFAFRDPDRVLGILRDAGYANPKVDVVALALTPAGDATDFADQVMAIGPVEAAIRHHEAKPAQIERVRDEVLDRVRAFETPQGVRVPAEINFFTATVE